MKQHVHDYSVHGLTIRSAIDFTSVILEPSNGDRPQITLEEPHTETVAETETESAAETAPKTEGHTGVLLRTGWCEIARRQTSTSGDGSTGQNFSMSYPLHGFTFAIQASTTHIHIQPIIQRGQWAQMLPIMGRGAVVTFACRLLGFPALHANTVVLNGETIAFAGASGAGKTLTSSLALLAGAELLSDDVTVVDEVGLVHPGLLEIRLRVDDPLGCVVADSLAKLPGMQVEETADERSAFRFGHVETPGPRTLTRVILPYLDTAADRFAVEPISPGVAVMSLLKANRLVGWVDPAFQRSDFSFAALVAESTPVQRLRMPKIAADEQSVASAAEQLVELLASTTP